MAKRFTPRQIGSIELGACRAKELQSLLTPCPDLGVVDVSTIMPDDPILLAMEKVVNRSGYCYRARAPVFYGLREYVYGAGSIFTHDDPGMGLAAAVLVHTSDLSSRLINDSSAWNQPGDCELIADGSVLPVAIGDVFIFNADRHHAWLANCRWVLATHAIRRRRKPSLHRLAASKQK